MSHGVFTPNNTPNCKRVMQGYADLCRAVKIRTKTTKSENACATKENSIAYIMKPRGFKKIIDKTKKWVYHKLNIT